MEQVRTKPTPAELIEAHQKRLDNSEPIPDDLSLDQIADDVVRGKRTLSPPQMRLLIELLPYYRPKLTAVAHYQGSFAEALEQALRATARPRLSWPPAGPAL
jgi:hypothetical protein